MKFTDTNAWYGSWPFATLPELNAGTHTRRVSGCKISNTLVSSFNSIFQVDPMPGNRDMFHCLSSRKGVHFLPVINPRTPAWKDHFEELINTPLVVGVRLLPSYHNYKLNSVRVRKLVERIEKTNLRLIITARLVDERHEHQALSIKPVSVPQLADFLKRFPKSHPLIQALGIHELKELSEAKETFSTDTSFAEWENTLKVLKTYLPISRIQFGSLSPLQVEQAQVDKVRMSSISESQREAVANRNAQRYFRI